MTKNETLDTFIGEKVKQHRIAAGMSQNKLASYLGVTFQQVQKYEKGINRISASTLYTIANVLNTNLSYFFEGFGEEKLHSQSNENHKERLDLIRSFSAIRNEKLKSRIRDPVRAVSNVSC